VTGASGTDVRAQPIAMTERKSASDHFGGM
jgi:hypothetical protein